MTEKENKFKEGGMTFKQAFETLIGAVNSVVALIEKDPPCVQDDAYNTSANPAYEKAGESLRMALDAAQTSYARFGAAFTEYVKEYLGEDEKTPESAKDGDASDTAVKAVQTLTSYCKGIPCSDECRLRNYCGVDGYFACKSPRFWPDPEKGAKG